MMKDKLDKMKADLKLCSKQSDVEDALAAVENAILNIDVEKSMIETNDALAKKISTVKRVINSQEVIDKLVVTIRDVIAESGGHSLESFSGDYLWQTREPINITKIAREVVKTFKDELHD